MSTMETIEYYDSCPSCGAVNDGSGVCTYCGSSLVKNRTVTEIDRTLEDQILEEDAGLPIVQGKTGVVNPFLKFFCPLFGGIFLLVPTILCASFVGVGMMMPWMVLFFSIFWIIGAASFVPLIQSIRRAKSCKNGQRITGVVRGYSKSNTSVNGEPTKTIRLRIDQGGSRIVVFNTGDTRIVYPVGTTVMLRTDGVGYAIEGAVAGS